MLKDIKKILVITLSNIGDVVLTTPVISVLQREFPNAQLSVMVGPRAKDFFENVPGIELIVYDKRSPIKQKLKLVLNLRRPRYDLVVDLRNTIFPLLIGAKYRTSLLSRVPADVIHMKDQHLNKLQSLGINTAGAPFWIWSGKDEESRIDQIFSQAQIRPLDKLVAVSPGARSIIKRWSREGFAEICDRLIDQYGLKVIMIGDRADQELIAGIISLMQHKPVDLSGQTRLRDLAALFKRCRLHITNDSAPMHISIASDLPTLAIFGPTDWRKYGPTGSRGRSLHSRQSCSPCEVAECRYGQECMKSISPEEVYECAKKMLSASGD